MKCIRCGNETYKSTTTEAIELNGGVLVIRNIPCYKCEICDEIHFTGDVVKKIEQIIASAKQHLQELSVVNFATAA
ncbi:MAG: YgiT-type zinc finger protein [Treponema sp.]|nr:YgiT-type zinc finger protein [Spirochaetia bacterium]MDD7450630.1 YgiT-type zinc finger protein [Treponema sp.]MDY2923354.1 YgiT-type zinc finger protein [Treponema sp.]